jgi:hypothetical protein
MHPSLQEVATLHARIGRGWHNVQDEDLLDTIHNSLTSTHQIPSTQGFLREKYGAKQSMLCS